MGYKDIVAGVKKGAKITGARYIKASTGTLGVEIAFQFLENNELESLRWVGWCSQKAMPRTMKTLVDVMDFNGDDRMGPDSSMVAGAVNTQKEYELVTDWEEYEDAETGEKKKRLRVQWVNLPGGGSAFASLTPQESQGAFAASGFKAAFFAQKSQNPGMPLASSPKASAPTAQRASGPIPDSELPF